MRDTKVQAPLLSPPQPSPSRLTALLLAPLLRLLCVSSWQLLGHQAALSPLGGAEGPGAGAVVTTPLNWSHRQEP